MIGVALLGDNSRVLFNLSTRDGTELLGSVVAGDGGGMEARQLVVMAVTVAGPRYENLPHSKKRGSSLHKREEE